MRRASFLLAVLLVALVVGGCSLLYDPHPWHGNYSLLPPTGSCWVHGVYMPEVCE